MCYLNHFQTLHPVVVYDFDGDAPMFARVKLEGGEDDDPGCGDEGVGFLKGERHLALIQWCMVRAETDDGALGVFTWRVEDAVGELFHIVRYGHLGIATLSMRQSVDSELRTYEFPKRYFFIFFVSLF